MMTEPPVNAFAAQHGMYRQETIAVTAGEFDDSEPVGNVRVTRNRAVTTVERWKAAGDLDEAEAEVLRLERRLEAARNAVGYAAKAYANALDALHSRAET